MELKPISRCIFCEGVDYKTVAATDNLVTSGCLVVARHYFINQFTAYDFLPPVNQKQNLYV